MGNICVILASASPRRRELLSRLGIDFDVIPAQGEEKVTSDDPIQVVQDLAVQKASEIAGCTDIVPALIIGADTIVVKNGEILGKPRDEDDAFRMLNSLQGSVHQVYTGVCLILRQDQTEQTIRFYEMTQVYFNPMTKEDIRAYIATGDPMDKAGAYGIQSGGGAYINHIEGDYDNVVGLPVKRLQAVLDSLGIHTAQPCVLSKEDQAQSEANDPTLLQCMPGAQPGGNGFDTANPPKTICTGADIKTRLHSLSAAQRLHTPQPPAPRHENAVLLPLIETRDGYDILFEMRALDLKHQPGDICLPGGRIEDGEQPAQAVLREAAEELLIQKEQIRILFPMDGLIGPGDRTVWPFAAILTGYEGTFSSDEVDHTFRVPLGWFLTHPPKVYTGRRTTVPQEGFPYERIAGGRDYWNNGYEYDILVYDNEGTAIWGITARIVNAFVHLYLGNH